MLKSHIDAVEAMLIAKSKIPANSGHPVNKGTPREIFIREFLQEHLSIRAAIGTGEIIHAKSKSNETRNQFDIVIYKSNYPRLHFGGNIFGFFAESVVATIEVKSTLTKEGVMQAVAAARNIKLIERNIITSLSSGHQPPSILNYVVAYNGPSLRTLLSWMEEVYKSQNIGMPQMGETIDSRASVPSPAIDGIFILGKGFIHFDNARLMFLSDEMRSQDPRIRWCIANNPNGNLLYLFLLLTEAISGFEASWMNPMPYLTNFKIDSPIQGGFWSDDG